MTTQPGIDAQCCAGTIDKGTPLGSVEDIAGHKVYVAAPVPASFDNIVVIATDVFGYTLPNTRLIADKFAAKGYYCIVPDYFKGTEPPADLMDDITNLGSKTASIGQKISGFGRMMWHMPGTAMRNNDEKNNAVIKEVIAAVKTTRGVKKVALIGYCWGGNLAIKLAQQADGVDVVVVNHPGGLSLTIPKDFTAIVKPILVILSETDGQIKPKERDVIIETLNKRTEEVGLRQDVEWFEGVDHGFAVRGNENDPHVNAQREKAFDHALAWFEKEFNA
ncbi:dienelactone hydrolase [Chytriomyces sp. MP71]|nr:dienelactone hydrolase [Chytriomyces sp. MP71]